VDKRKVASLVLRVCFSIGLLAFLYSQVPQFDTDELLPDWNDATPRWLAAALALMILSQVMSTLRWQQTAESVGVHARLRRLFSHYMAGVFLSNFVPTTVGGDVLRVNRLSRDTNNGLLNPSLRSLGASTRIAFVVGAITLLGLVAVVAIAGSEAVGKRLDKRQGWLRWLEAVHTGIDSLRANPNSFWRIVTAGVAYQVVLVFAAWCAARAIGITEAGPTALFAFFPAVLILQVLPLGIGGLGVREGALVLLLGGLGVPDEQSIALGLLLYFLTLASSLIGLPLLVFGNRSQRKTDAAGGPDGAEEPAGAAP